MKSDLVVDSPVRVFLLRAKDNVMSQQFEVFLISICEKYDIASYPVQSKKNSFFYQVGVILKESHTILTLQYLCNQFLQLQNVQERSYILASKYSSRQPGCFKPEFEREAQLILQIADTKQNAPVKQQALKIKKNLAGVKAAANGAAAAKKKIARALKRKEILEKFLKDQADAQSKVDESSESDSDDIDEILMNTNNGEIEKNAFSLVE